MAGSGRGLGWLRRMRRGGAGVTLLTYLLALWGPPFPAGAARKKDGVPFPCQDHPCGCQSAEECWRHCCCFTPEERWTWARAQGVTPPPYAEKPRRTAARSTPPKESHCSHCSTSKESHCPHCPAPKESHCPHCHSQAPVHRESPEARAQGPCCSSSSGHSSAPETAPGADGPGSGKQQSASAARGWTLAIAARHCQGQSDFLSNGVPVVPPEPPRGWRPDFPCLGWLASTHPSGASVYRMPVEPPPRFVLR
jgi:hypothetical protein